VGSVVVVVAAVVLAFVTSAVVVSVVVVKVVVSGVSVESVGMLVVSIMLVSIFVAASLFGKFNPAGLHVVALGWTLATMAGLYVIGRQLFDRGTGLVAALLYSVYQPWGTFKNLAFNGEMIMNLPLVWAYAIVFVRSSRRLRPELLVAGALLGAAFLLKQPAAIAAVPLGVYLLLPTYRTDRRLTPAASLIHAFLLTAGFFGVLGVDVAVLQKQG
jgi:4-amino-4-deoxy-L-arabinose transferase-like glycosyltransferase